jgi:ATP-dependent Clp protease ATP-binding subunit ClpA
MDEFHTVQNLGKMANDSTPGLGNALKPYMTRGDFRIIGATTYDEFKLITDKALLRRMSIIEIGVPDDEAIKTIIHNSFARYIGQNQIKVNLAVINYVFDLSQTLPGNNPDKAKDIVDIVVANAKLSDTDTITKAFVSSTFDMYFMKETKLPDKAASDIFSINSQDDTPNEFKLS